MEQPLSGSRVPTPPPAAPPTPASLAQAALDRRGPPARGLIATGMALLLAMAPLAAFVGLRALDRSVHAEVQHQLETTLATHAAALEAWATARTQLVTQVTTDPMVYAGAEQLKAVPTDQLATHPVQLALRQRMGWLLNMAEMKGFFIARPDGRAVASMRDENLGAPHPLMLQPEAWARLRLGQPAVGRPQPSDVPIMHHGRLVDRAPTLFVAAPIVDPLGRHHGVLTLRVDPVRELYPQLRGSSLTGAGRASLIGPDGSLLSPDDSGALTLDHPAHADALIADITTRRQGSALVPRTGLDGAPVVAAWTWVEPLSTILLLERDAGAAFASLHKTRRMVWSGVAGFEAVLLVLLLTLVGRMREAQRARAQLQGIIDAAPIGISVRDAAGRLVLVNRLGWAWLEDGKLPRPPLRGRAPGDPLPEVSGLAPTSQGIHTTHTWLPDALHGSPTVCTIGVDVSSEVEANRALTALNTELEARVEARTRQALDATAAKDTMLARLSHELRTPLTGVLGMLGLVRDVELSDEARDYVERAWATAGLLRSMLNEVLDFSKLQRDEVELEQRAFALDEVLAPLSSLVLASHPDESVQLRIHTSPELPTRLIGDSARLAQVLTNLVGNASKFTQRGHIQVHLSARPDLDDDDQLWLSGRVSDTGAGFPPETAAQIFEPYRQASSAVARTHGGTGLGLPITRRICEAMGGEIHAEGHPGQGATFTFCVRMRRVPGLALPAPTGLPVLAGVATPHQGIALQDALVAIGVPCTLWTGGPVPAGPWRAVFADAALAAADRGALREVAIACGAHHRLLASPAERRLRARHGESSPTRIVAKPVLRGALDWLVETERPGATAPALDAPRVTSSGRRSPVLVVEDNEVIGILITRMLDRQGLDAVVARSVDHALTLAARPWTLALVDLHLPDGTGDTVAAALRAHHGPALPVVALTGDTTGEAAACFAEVGVHDLLVKPIQNDELRTMLRHFGLMPAGKKSRDAG